MKNERLGFFDYVMAFLMILLMFMAASCTSEDDIFVIQEPTLELDARLPLDTNGYYHLKLNPNTNQTTHRISGKVLNTIEPTKVSWWSNLNWEYNGEVVPTINGSSYVGDGGEINTMIAPIFSMRTDTLEVKSTINEWNIIQTIKIVLE
jgi:hypothetical protein